MAKTNYNLIDPIERSDRESTENIDKKMKEMNMDAKRIEREYSKMVADSKVHEIFSQGSVTAYGYVNEQPEKIPSKDSPRK